MGGILTMTREPGGFSTLTYEFTAFGGAVAPRMVSWLTSAIRNARIFRLPIVISPQLVPAVDFGVSASADFSGVPWANNQPWSNGSNWAFEPIAPVASLGLKGSTQIIIDMTELGQILWHGHVIGEGRNAYMVDDIEYEGVYAYATVSPPLRRTVNVGSRVLFRPYMTGICTSPDGFEDMFDRAGIVRPGTVTFTEVPAE